MNGYNSRAFTISEKTPNITNTWQEHDPRQALMQALIILRLANIQVHSDCSEGSGKHKFILNLLYAS